MSLPSTTRRLTNNSTNTSIVGRAAAVAAAAASTPSSTTAPSNGNGDSSPAANSSNSRRLTTTPTIPTTTTSTTNAMAAGLAAVTTSTNRSIAGTTSTVDKNGNRQVELQVMGIEKRWNRWCYRCVDDQGKQDWYHYEKYLSLYNGDVISGKIDSNNTFVSQPIVHCFTSKDGFMSYCSRVLKNKYQLATNLYKFLERYSNTMASRAVAVNLAVVEGVDNSAGEANLKKSVVDTMNDLASLGGQTTYMLIASETGIDYQTVEKFCRIWVKDYLIRRLILLGCTRPEVYEAANYWMSHADMYNRLMTDPLSVYHVNFQTCMAIANHLRIKYTVEAKEVAKMMRELNEELHHKGWTCKPLKMLSYSDDDVQVMVDKFHCQIRNNCIYLPHMWQAEDIIINALIDKDQAMTATTTTTVSSVGQATVNQTAAADATTSAQITASQASVNSDDVEDVDNGDEDYDEAEDLLSAIQSINIAGTTTKPTTSNDTVINSNDRRVPTSAPSPQTPSVATATTIMTPPPSYEESEAQTKTFNLGDRLHDVDGGGRPLNAQQKSALDMVLRERVSVITGGPGTGKSTIITCLSTEFGVRRLNTLVTSFTGKAVSTLRNKHKGSNYYPTISTIHTSLASHDLFDAIIIDEMSMVSLPLFARCLRKHAHPKLRIVLVGDHNQLPSIEQGEVLMELMKVLPTVTLTEDCRRKTHDGVLFRNLGIIIDNNKLAKADQEDFSNFDFADGDMAYPEAKEGQDMYFVQGAGHTDVVKLTRMLKQNFPLKDTDLTVVCPYREPLAELNKQLRKIWLGSDVMLKSDNFGNDWAVNDRIIMTENRSDINVMNGEEGRITTIENSNLHCNFDGNDVVIPMSVTKKSYAGDEEGEGTANPLSSKLLQLSYALTIHKSQGSEWPIVIYYIPPNKRAGGFLSRRLSFTALSRTKNLCLCVSDDLDVLAGSITTRTPKRIDNLAASYRTAVGIVDPAAGGNGSGGSNEANGSTAADYDPFDGVDCYDEDDYDPYADDDD